MQDHGERDGSGPGVLASGTRPSSPAPEALSLPGGTRFVTNEGRAGRLGRRGASPRGLPVPGFHPSFPPTSLLSLREEEKQPRLLPGAMAGGGSHPRKTTQTAGSSGTRHYDPSRPLLNSWRVFIASLPPVRRSASARGPGCSSDHGKCGLSVTSCVASG